MMAPVHPLSTYQIGTAMPGPVDKVKFKFKIKDCSPLDCTSSLLINLKSGNYVENHSIPLFEVSNVVSITFVSNLKLTSLCSLMNLKKMSRVTR